MAIKIKNTADVKWYLYISTAKIRMLYDQMYSESNTKRASTVSASAGFVSGSVTSESEEGLNRDDMLRSVVEELEARELVGTPDEPKTYFKGIMRMRWGLYGDLGTRPEGEPALVYFGGFDRDRSLLVGLGGSSKHVTGYEGASSTYSRSATPALVEWLVAGLHRDGPPEIPRWLAGGREHEVYEAMALAQYYLRPPTQDLEFVAKTLASGNVKGYPHVIDVESARALLGTPLYVAQAHPLPQEMTRWGLDDE